ncbi:membrane-bound PQQ-dependent dehydrogenase, glucose/quinate/shikimate family [Rhizobium sp. L1K21]|uniref:membrane-bound PQQ-dependent dehydrogenase, glucose/quinate/shikimate family n=1 Tax=Rhizobium sp. L1K21 TaxID=2954933 RepID=UPI002092F440|nr:membrane-bound PQQ-dependent dehydrogenase, glucose/quinate/shikimate family [Rhizobium sp. L1K21]MCO6184683.1 membrane-bound PQQ-dependent dehydrogenase, glucose/quinate/shikimate family [Rhizobium sp. L1K21]
MFRMIMSVILLLLGVVTGAGGVWLAAIGGSLFYVVLAAGLVLTAAFLWMRSRWALHIYGLTLALTLIWSLWEVGFDWWPLAARGAVLIAIGVLLLLPPVVKSLNGSSSSPARYLPVASACGIVVIASIAVGLYSMGLTPHDKRGAIDEARMDANAGGFETAGVPDGEWQSYGRTPYGRRYSPLNQITPDNIENLKVAWTYETGQERSDDDPVETTYEVTPLVVNDTMYVCTPFSVVIALDPVTGKEKWRFDPEIKKPPYETTQHMTCRGVSYYDASKYPQSGGLSSSATSGENEQAKLSESQSDVTTEAAGVTQNIVAGTAKPGDPNPQVSNDIGDPTAVPTPECIRRLFVPTSDGRLITISAETGEICPGFGGEDGTIDLWANMPNVTPGSYYSTSPPVVTPSLVIVGGTVNDNVSTTSPSGVIRAFDVNTGELVWNFDSKKPDSTEPVGSGETYSENAPNTWSVSSYDPELNLIYVPMGNQSPDQFGGNRSPEVERISSSVLALDADTGEERWVYQTVHHDLWDMDVPAQPSLVTLNMPDGPVPALVQPTKQGEVFVLDRRTGEPILPVTEEPAPQGAAEGDTAAPTQPVSALSFKPEPLREKDMWGATFLDQLACRIEFRELRYEGRYTPPSLKGTIVYPGNFGAFNWGAVAVDPERQVMFGMPVYLAFTSKLIERPNGDSRVVTKDGQPPLNENFGAPYAAKMGAFLSPVGLPCQAPPWGYIAAADLTTGKVIYKHVNGTVRDLAPVPLPFEMGVPGIGGPIITKGGVAFLSATLDYYVRGYDLKTGEEIWRRRLPAGGQATPSTYLGSDGRQYLVVVAGGHGSTGTKAGDSIIAYALDNG